MSERQTKFHGVQRDLVEPVWFGKPISTSYAASRPQLNNQAHQITTSELAAELTFETKESKYYVASRRRDDKDNYCFLSTMEATKVVHLKMDKPQAPAEFGFAYLDEKGDAYKIANNLKDLLETWLLKKFITQRILEVTVWCKDWDGKIPSDWKRHVHGSEIDMAKIEAHGDSFVIWGQTIMYEEGMFQPYILLTRLGAEGQNQMEIFRDKEVLPKISETLRFCVLEGYNVFMVGVIGDFAEELETKLDKLADEKAESDEKTIVSMPSIN